MIEIIETLIMTVIVSFLLAGVCILLAWMEAKRKGITLKEELFNEDED